MHERWSYLDLRCACIYLRIAREWTLSISPACMDFGGILCHLDQSHGRSSCGMNHATTARLLIVRRWRSRSPSSSPSERRIKNVLYKCPIRWSKYYLRVHCALSKLAILLLQSHRCILQYICPPPVASFRHRSCSRAPSDGAIYLIEGNGAVRKMAMVSNTRSLCCLDQGCRCVRTIIVRWVLQLRH